jgi:integrase
MRLKDYDSKDGKRVWLSREEISRVLDEAEGREQTVAFMLAVRCGLRSEEIVGDDDRDEKHGVRPVDIRRTDIGDVVRVWNGKGGKYRETPAPARIKDVLMGMETAPNEEIVDVSKSTLYRWVSRAGERLHAETGDEGWLELGPHDLRRTWGVQLLEQGVLPSVVMEWGGWEDWETFREHYLAEFSPEALRRETQKVDFLADGRGRESEQRDSYSMLAEEYT